MINIFWKLGLRKFCKPHHFTQRAEVAPYLGKVHHVCTHHPSENPFLWFDGAQTQFNTRTSSHLQSKMSLLINWEDSILLLEFHILSSVQCVVESWLWLDRRNFSFKELKIISMKKTHKWYNFLVFECFVTNFCARSHVQLSGSSYDIWKCFHFYRNILAKNLPLPWIISPFLLIILKKAEVQLQFQEAVNVWDILGVGLFS